MPLYQLSYIHKEAGRCRSPALLCHASTASGFSGARHPSVRQRIDLRIPLPCAPYLSKALACLQRAGPMPRYPRRLLSSCCSLLFRGRLCRALHPLMWARSSRACGLCRAPHRVACHDDAGSACCCQVVKEPLRCFVLRWMNYTKAKRALQAKFTRDEKILRDGGARNMILNMDSKTLIKALGGTKKVAELCEITPGSVSLWHQRGIPHAWMKYLRAARPKTFIRLEREAAARAAEAERASSAA